MSNSFTDPFYGALGSTLRITLLQKMRENTAAYAIAEIAGTKYIKANMHFIWRFQEAYVNGDNKECSAMITKIIADSMKLVSEHPIKVSESDEQIDAIMEKIRSKKGKITVKQLRNDIGTSFTCDVDDLKKIDDEIEKSGEHQYAILLNTKVENKSTLVVVIIRDVEQ